MRSKEKRNNFSWCLSVLVWRWNMRRVISQGTVRDVGLAPLICLPAYRVHTQTHTWACTYNLWTRYTIVFILYIIGLFARCVSNGCAGLPVWRLSLFCAFFFVLSISFDVNKLFNLRERHMFFGRGGGSYNVTRVSENPIYREQPAAAARQQTFSTWETFTARNINFERWDGRSTTPETKNLFTFLFFLLNIPLFDNILFMERRKQ